MKDCTITICIGFLAGFLTTFASLPQVYEIYKTNKTKGISIMFAVTYTTGLLCWSYYGIKLNTPPIYIFNIISLFCWLYISYKVIQNKNVECKDVNNIN